MAVKVPSAAAAGGTARQTARFVCRGPQGRPPDLFSPYCLQAGPSPWLDAWAAIYDAYDVSDASKVLSLRYDRYMNKKEFIDEWARRTNAKSSAAARRGVEAFIDIIVGTVAAGQEVRVGGLGVFDRDYRKAREARNPNTNEVVEVPGKWVMRFRPSTAVKTAVNK